MIGYASGEPDSQKVPIGFDMLFPGLVAELKSSQYTGDFIAFIANSGAALSATLLKEGADLVNLNSLILDVPDTLIGTSYISDLTRLDHDSFWDAGYPGVMVTDTADLRNPNYHCESGLDVIEDLDHDFATKVIQSTVYATAKNLGIVAK